MEEPIEQDKAGAALKGLVIIFSMVIVFHVLVILKVVPSSIVWGGRMSDEKLIGFELVSIALNLLMLFIVLVKARMIRVRLPAKLLTICLYAISILFMLNTLGNLFSLNEFEKYFFTPLTLLLAVFSFKAARS